MESSKNENFPKRGEIYWISLDPTRGNEIKKTRPALIISNDLANEHTHLVIIATITSNVSKIYQTEAKLLHPKCNGKIMLQQCRVIDKSRIGEKIGRVEKEVLLDVDRALKIVFSLS